MIKVGNKNTASNTIDFAKLTTAVRINVLLSVCWQLYCLCNVAISNKLLFYTIIILPPPPYGTLIWNLANNSNNEVQQVKHDCTLIIKQCFGRQESWKSWQTLSLIKQKESFGPLWPKKSLDKQSASLLKIKSRTCQRDRENNICHEEKKTAYLRSYQEDEQENGKPTCGFQKYTKI